MKTTFKKIMAATSLLTLALTMTYAKPKEKAKTKPKVEIIPTDPAKGFETLLWGDTVEQVKEKGYAIEHKDVDKLEFGVSEETEVYTFINNIYNGTMLFLNGKLYAVYLYPLEGKKFEITDLKNRFGEYNKYEYGIDRIENISDAKTDNSNNVSGLVLTPKGFYYNGVNNNHLFFGSAEKNVTSMSIIYNQDMIILCDWQYFMDNCTDGRKITHQKSFKQEAEAKIQAEKDAVKNEKAKIIAKGYIYHGIDEDKKNGKLFSAGALETGHAYYISGYMVGGGGSTGGVIISIFGSPTYHIVEYANQKVKGEVAMAAGTFGTITVVAVGGKAPLYIPIIIGVIQE